jgi:hypothetical protein
MIFVTALRVVVFFEEANRRTAQKIQRRMPDQGNH